MKYIYVKLTDDEVWNTRQYNLVHESKEEPDIVIVDDKDSNREYDAMLKNLKYGDSLIMDTIESILYCDSWEMKDMYNKLEELQNLANDKGFNLIKFGGDALGMAQRNLVTTMYMGFIQYYSNGLEKKYNLNEINCKIKKLTTNIGR